MKSTWLTKAKLLEMGDTEAELATSPSVTTQCFYGGNDITMAINSSTMKDVLDNTVTELLGMANQ